MISLTFTIIYGEDIGHMLHVWNIYLHVGSCVIFRVNVGNYSSPMEHMGCMILMHAYPYLVAARNSS